jgi:uncharacterized protein YgiM (DUF1202 family)
LQSQNQSSASLSSSINNSVSILGNLESQGSFTAQKEATFKAPSFFEKLVTFLGDIFFAGRPTFNNDTAGFARIKKGQRKVDIVFKREYETVPAVTVNKVWSAQKDTISMIDQLDGYFLPKSEFTLAALSPKGFSIVLEDPAIADLEFSWVAIAIKDATTFESPDTAQINDRPDILGILASPTPSIEISATVPPTPTPDQLSVLSDQLSVVSQQATPSSFLPTTDNQLLTTTPTFPPSPTPTQITNNREQITITITSPEVGYVRIRDEATSSANEIGQIPSGTTLLSSEIQSDWYKVTYNGKTGWISGKYVRTISP